MNELLGYLTNDVAKHSRTLSRMERAFSKQTRFNLLSAIAIFALCLTVSAMDKRIKALEGETG